MTDSTNARYHVEAAYLFDDQLADFIVSASRLPRLPFGNPVRTDFFRASYGVTATVVFDTDCMDAAIDVARELIDSDLEACLPPAIEEWDEPFSFEVTRIDGLADAMSRDAAAMSPDAGDSLSGDFSWGVDTLDIAALPSDAGDVSLFAVEAVAA